MPAGHLAFSTTLTDVTEGSELLAQMAADKVSRTYFETFVRHSASNERPLIRGEEILGLTPEEWAADLGSRVANKFKDFASQGITRQELLEWRQSNRERLSEILRDRVARIEASESPTA